MRNGNAIFYWHFRVFPFIIFLDIRINVVYLREKSYFNLFPEGGKFQ
jgi:hypothetical protein